MPPSSSGNAFIRQAHDLVPVPLPGLPWSPSFMAAREAALEGEAPRIDIGASRTKPGTINALVVS